jgi:hypothetical protein
LCDICGIRPATMQVNVLRDGRRETLDICDYDYRRLARQQGLARRWNRCSVTARACSTISSATLHRVTNRPRSPDDDVLTLGGEKKLEREEERENMHFTERAFGTFPRSRRLPFRADPGQVKASFENGVLTITLPKSKAQEMSRKIPLGGQTKT